MLHRYSQLHFIAELHITERQKHGTSRTSGYQDVKVTTPPRRKPVDSTNSKSNPGTPESRVTRNRKLLHRNLSNDEMMPNPMISSLKEGTRSRTNSLPGSLHHGDKGKKTSSRTQPIRVSKE